MNRFFTSVTVLVFVFCFTGILSSESLPDKWEGKGKIIVSWCKQKEITFELNISKEGKVWGKVGDAEFVNGLVKNNSFLLKLLGNPDYIIDGELKGYLVGNEKIKRKSGKFIVNISNTEINGGFRTSGTKVGGKESMVFTVVDVLLHKK